MPQLMMAYAFCGQLALLQNEVESMLSEPVECVLVCLKSHALRNHQIAIPYQSNRSESFICLPNDCYEQLLLVTIIGS